MVVTLVGMVTVVSAVEKANECLPMLVTLDGIAILVSDIVE
jgi:hypothetical protein